MTNEALVKIVEILEGLDSRITQIEESLETLNVDGHYFSSFGSDYETIQTLKKMLQPADMLIPPIPPENPVPWFLETFQVGERVTFDYNHGLGGIHSIKGEITAIDPPDLVLDGKPYTMANILWVQKEN